MNLKFLKSISLILLFFTGCYSELSDIELGKIEWSPDLGLPLVDSKFTVKNLLEARDSTFQYGSENGTVVIYFNDDSLFSESASNYYSLQNRNFILPPLFLTPEEINSFNTNGEVNVLREIAVDYGVQSGLTEILIDQGTIDLAIEENFPANGNLSLKFRTIQSPPNTPNILDFNYGLSYANGGNEFSETEATDSFENISFDFVGEEDDSKIFIAYDLLLQKVADNDLVFGQNSIQLSFDFTNMEFGALYGDLSPQSIVTEKNKIETNFFQNEFLNEINYFFEDPRFRIIYNNSMGLPVRFNVASFSSFKNGEENEIPVNEPINLNAASEEGDVTSNVANFDAIFKSLINELPESVELQIEGQIDPDDTPNNFVTRESNIQVGYEVEIPLQLSLSGLRIEQTFSFSGIDPQDLNFALFKFSSENSLPIELDFKAVFLDADSVELFTLFDGRFLEAGNVGQPSSLTDLIELSDNPETANNELDFLQNADRIGIVATVATTNNGSEIVEISVDAAVKFNLAVQAQYTVKLNEKD